MQMPGMLGDTMSEDRAQILLQKACAEPITALITIPGAFIGRAAWELAWLSYPAVSWILRWRMT